MERNTETDRLRNWMTLCGVLAPFVAFLAISISVWVHSEWFTWTGHALSDLGHIERDLFWIFNLGLVLAGTCGVIFSLLLVDYLDHVVSRIGATLFLLGSFSLSLVGALPLGVEYHSLAAIAFFTFCTLGMLVVGVGESLRREPLGYVWVILVVIGSGLAYLTLQWFDGYALPELVGAVAYAIFTVGYAGRLRKR